MNLYYSLDYNRTSVDFETTRKADALARSLRQAPIPGVRLVAPAPLTSAEMARTHDPAYVHALLTGDPASLAASNGIGWDADLFAAIAASNGGVLAAAREALATGGMSGSFSSGLHHASYRHGTGFCTVNGLAIAAHELVRDGAVRRIAIVDFDAHCGGGTVELLRRHGLDAVGHYDVSVNGFDRYTPDAQHRLQMANALNYLPTCAAMLRLVDRADLDLVIYNAGMDPHEAAGGLRGIDDMMIAQREAMLFDWADRHGLPVAFALAGGYTVRTDMAGLVDLHRLTVAAAANPRVPTADGAVSAWLSA